MTFIASLSAAWARNDSLLCVGLDPDPAKFPAHLQGRPDAIFEFCKGIVDATADLVCSFKPQIAYFAAHRAEDQLEALIAHIHERHPGIPVILDAKRGDIGSTAEQYAVEAFERFRADAITASTRNSTSFTQRNSGAACGRGDAVPSGAPPPGEPPADAPFREV